MLMTAAEEYFTSRSVIDVKESKANHPDFALVLDLNDDKLPNTFDLTYKRVPVPDMQVGSYISWLELVRLYSFRRQCYSHHRALDRSGETIGGKSWGQDSGWCKERRWSDDCEGNKDMVKNFLLFLSRVLSIFLEEVLLLILSTLRFHCFTLQSKKIKEAVNTPSYGSEFFHATFSVDKKVTLIHLEDRPRPGALDIILELREQGKLCVMMLTGDHKSCVMRVAA